MQPVEVRRRAVEPAAAVLVLDGARRQAHVGLAGRLALDPLRRDAVRRTCLQVAAGGLLALDGLEERLEVALAEALGALALDDLDEDGRAGRRASR